MKNIFFERKCFFVSFAVLLQIIIDNFTYASPYKHSIHARPFYIYLYSSPTTDTVREREIETTETVLQQTLCCVVGEQLPGGEVCVDEGLGAVGGKTVASWRGVWGRVE
jgi:hypothetical protein